jgi:hypothetical protein
VKGKPINHLKRQEFTARRADNLDKQALRAERSRLIRQVGIDTTPDGEKRQIIKRRAYYIAVHLEERVD